MTKKFKLVAIGGHVTLLGRPSVILRKLRLHQAIQGDSRTSLNAVEVESPRKSSCQVKTFISPEADVKVVKKLSRV